MRLQFGKNRFPTWKHNTYTCLTCHALMLTFFDWIEEDEPGIRWEMDLYEGMRL